MAILKSLEPAELRQGARKGRKVLYVYDRAGLNFAEWYRWKQGSGVYFLSRVMDTMILTSQGRKEFDSADPINANVLSDELVLPASSKHVLRRVRFYDVIGQVA